MIRKQGRKPKLDDTAELEIVALHGAGGRTTLQMIADRYGIHPRTIYNILKRRGASPTKSQPQTAPCGDATPHECTCGGEGAA